MSTKMTVLQRMATGEEKASEDFLQTYRGIMQAMARGWFNQPQDVEDIVQESFIEIWRSAHRFDPNVASEASFVKMITRRQMINRLRKNSRNKDVSFPEGVDFAADESVSMEQTLDAERITGIIQKFRPEQRTVLSLFFKLGMSHGEISDATSIALGTVKSYIRRGVMTMRDQINRPKLPLTA